jgi:hypothetical protein
LGYNRRNIIITARTRPRAPHLSDQPPDLVHQPPLRHPHVHRGAVQACHADRDLRHNAAAVLAYDCDRAIVCFLITTAAVIAQLPLLLRRLPGITARVALRKPGREEGLRLGIEQHRCVLGPCGGSRSLRGDQRTERAVDLSSRALFSFQLPKVAHGNRSECSPRKYNVQYVLTGDAESGSFVTRAQYTRHKTSESKDIFGYFGYKPKPRGFAGALFWVVGVVCVCGAKITRYPRSGAWRAGAWGAALDDDMTELITG